MESGPEWGPDGRPQKGEEAAMNSWLGKAGALLVAAAAVQAVEPAHHGGLVDHDRAGRSSADLAADR